MVLQVHDRVPWGRGNIRVLNGIGGHSLFAGARRGDGRLQNIITSVVVFCFFDPRLKKRYDTNTFIMLSL